MTVDKLYLWQRQCPDSNVPTSYLIRADLKGAPDTDGDGVNDDVDLCPGTATGDPVDADGCSDAQLDTDGDGGERRR